VFNICLRPACCNLISLFTQVYLMPVPLCFGAALHHHHHRWILRWRWVNHDDDERRICILGLINRSFFGISDGCCALALSSLFAAFEIFDSIANTAQIFAICRLRQSADRDPKNKCSEILHKMQAKLSIQFCRYRRHLHID